MTQKGISPAHWKWYGSAGHFICASQCRFHLCTEIGGYLVSTVGELVYDHETRKVLGRSSEDQYEDIGYERKYETMAFKWKGRCKAKDCGCGLPTIVPNELLSAGCNTAGEAMANHYRICEQVARGEVASE